MIYEEFIRAKIAEASAIGSAAREISVPTLFDLLEAAS